MAIDVNLDAMMPDDLRAFITDCGHYQLLEKYARRKLVAMTLRAGGNIKSALRAEAACERIYQQLPQEVRW